jgi:hypothetical protein
MYIGQMPIRRVRRAGEPGGTAGVCARRAEQTRTVRQVPYGRGIGGVAGPRTVVFAFRPPGASLRPGHTHARPRQGADCGVRKLTYVDAAATRWLSAERMPGESVRGDPDENRERYLSGVTVQRYANA